MKEKAIIFIVGLLLGAIISTGSIYIYTLTNNSNNDQTQMNNPNGQEMPNGEMGGNMGTPPEMPNGNNNQGQAS